MPRGPKNSFVNVTPNEHLYKRKLSLENKKPTLNILKKKYPHIKAYTAESYDDLAQCLLSQVPKRRTSKQKRGMRFATMPV